MSRLRGRALNGWSFFFLVAALTLAVILIGLTTTGFATPEAAVEMIRLSVQLASPWVFLAFSASPLNQLAPSEFANWLLLTAVTSAFLSLPASVGRRRSLG